MREWIRFWLWTSPCAAVILYIWLSGMTYTASDMALVIAILWLVGTVANSAQARARGLEAQLAHDWREQGAMATEINRLRAELLRARGEL